MAINPEIDPIRQIVDDSVYADQDELAKQKRMKEENVVAKLWKEYEQARAFDEYARKQYAIDRRYAAGTADQTWAVNTNLIGSFVDILVSFLYARNPDVSVRKAKQVTAPGMADPVMIAKRREQEDFALTMELVISRLWKKRLKQAARRMVRSALSTGVGWLKINLICEGTNIPQMQQDLNDCRDNLAALVSLQAQMADPTFTSEKTPEELDAEEAKLQELEASLSKKVEVALRKQLAVDFVSSEDMQVSLDVRTIMEYNDANWTANAIYRPKSELREMFPRLTDEDVKTGKSYYQRQQKELSPMSETAGDVSADEAEQYTSAAFGTGSDGSQGIEFCKVVELWDRRTNHVSTMVDGCKVWAKEPYQPDYPSSRFNPYFGVAFYEVDGARHPQSLPQRLFKLQDEYARSRSTFRLMRERAKPGIIFDRTGLDPTDVRKIESGVEQEFIGVEPVIPGTPLQNLFAPKPVASVDVRMYDNTPILADMEKIAGVQEALQQAQQGTPITATEANIQQTGFASRTTADRDVLEMMLTDLAQYTGEVALGGMSLQDVQRIAGTAAYWPAGMDIEDLLTLMELEIVAGTTGKPKAMGDRDAWGVILPQIKETIIQIQQAFIMGNIPLATALTEILRETMVRMGDDTDVERFIPEAPPLPEAVPGAPAPGGPTPEPGPPGGPGAPPSGAAPNPLTDAPVIENPAV